MSKDDLNLRDDRLIIAPTSYRIVGPHAQSPGSQGVIQANADTINAFVTAQRNNVGISGLDHHKSFTSTPDLDIEYLHSFGQERITFTPYVTQPSIEEQPEPEYPSFEPEPFVPTRFAEEHVGPCLLVLFKQKDKTTGKKTEAVAAIDMSSLSSSGGSVVHQATVTNSDYGNDFIYTMQASFVAGNSLILTGMDFALKKGDVSTKLHLMTTALKDGIETTAPFVKTSTLGNVPPVMNSIDARTIYTPFDVFTYDPQKGKFSNAGVGAPTTSRPSMVTSDGTYYFQPVFTGDNVSFGFDGSTDQPQAVIDDANKKLHAQQGYPIQLVDVTQAFGAIVPTSTSSPVPPDYYSDFDAHLLTKTTTTMTTIGFTGTYSYSGAHISPGATPQTADNFVGGVFGGYYITFQGRTQVYAEAGSDMVDFSNHISFVTFSQNAGVDRIEIEVVEVSASASLGQVSPTGTPIKTLPANPSLASADSPDQYDRNVADAYLHGPPFDVDHVPFRAKTPPSGSNMPPDDLRQKANDAIYASGKTTFVLGNPVFGSNPRASIETFGHTIIGSGVGSAAISYTMIAFPFPPAPSDAKQPAYLMIQGGNPLTTTVYTPFDDSFSDGVYNGRGWLHASNGSHVIQGFLIYTEDGYAKALQDYQSSSDQSGGVLYFGDPKLYLDGEEFMTGLAKTLSCDPEDIRSLYMDIDLDVIKNLTNLTIGDPPDDNTGGGGGGGSPFQ